MKTDTPVTIARILVRPLGEQLYARGPDVPGLHIYGANIDQLWPRVMIGIKALFKLNKGTDVEVIPAGDAHEFPSAPAPCRDASVRALVSRAARGAAGDGRARRPSVAELAA